MNPWTNLAAPTLDDFEVMAKAALDALPEPFHALVDGVPFTVAEFADDETLKELGIEFEFDLMGLFRGVGMPQLMGQTFTGQMPNQIWLYRRAILDYWADTEHGETLGEVITHVLIHEIGHHFGYSDDDMEALEAAAERGE